MLTKFSLGFRGNWNFYFLDNFWVTKNNNGNKKIVVEKILLGQIIVAIKKTVVIKNSVSKNISSTKILLVNIIVVKNSFSKINSSRK